MIRRLLAFGMWCVVLTGGLFLLHRAGTSVPQASPETTAMAVVRIVGLALGWYLAAATVLGTGARLVGGVRAVRVTDVVVLPSLRRLLNTLVGASVALASTAPAAWAEPSVTADESSIVTIVRLPDDVAIVRLPDDVATPRRDAGPLLTTTLSSVPSTEASTTTITGSPAEEQATPPPPAPAALAEPAPPPDPSPPPTPPGPDPPTWTVAGGDHFWSIAERVLAEAWQRAPTDRDVDPYWRRLVDVNRSRLADRDNSDLLYTGQVLTVPAPPRPP